jgi:DNA-binding response OmpR family regulator
VSARRRRPPVPELVGRRILLVEDDYLVGETVREQIERFGCRVDGPIASVREARVLAESESFDLVLLDIRLIDGTSTALAEELTEKGGRVLFMTGYGDGGAVPESLANVGRLVKPFERETLKSALIAALG